MAKKKRLTKKEKLKQKKRMGRTKRRIVFSVVLLVLSFLLFSFGRISFLADYHAQNVYPLIAKALGSVSSLLPYSIAEILLYIVILWLVLMFLLIIISLIRKSHKVLSRLSKILLTISIVLFMYEMNCGILYHRTSFEETNGYTRIIRLQEKASDQVKIQMLQSLCEYLVGQVNLENEEAHSVSYTFEEEGSIAKDSVIKLQSDYECLSGSVFIPKYLHYPIILSVQKVTGVFSPFTIEANVNSDIPAYNIPFVMCHELSHLLGYMEEQEANFIAFLSCIQSDNAWFRYCGHLYGFVYAGNALASVDYETYEEVYSKLNEVSAAELQENNVFWKQYDGKIAETHETMNDSYLKANGQSDGTASYDRVTELMLAWFSQRKQ